ncbi:MAG: neocarzinostatin apoprotein domain-containing protein [Acidimicrobiia bacterium]
MAKLSPCRAVIGAFALSVVLAVATLASPALAATALPKLKVTPSTNLVNKEKVQLTGTGFPKKKKVYAVECFNTATSLTGCDVAHRETFTTTVAGTMPKKFFFTVHTGKIGTGKTSGTCGSTKKNAKKCAIAIGSGSLSYAGAPIAFKG